jgi:hypothetical protein
MSRFWVLVTVETHLPSWLHRARAPYVQEGVELTGVRAACDRVAARLDQDPLSRRELSYIATELQFLTRQVEQLVDASSAASGMTQEVRVAHNVLQGVRENLYRVQPYQSWPGVPSYSMKVMRGELERAIWNTRYAMIVLAWGRMHRQS